MFIKRDISVAESPNFLVRLLTPLTAATPTTAEPTHAHYCSLNSLLTTLPSLLLDRRVAWWRRCARRE